MCHQLHRVGRSMASGMDAFCVWEGAYANWNRPVQGFVSPLSVHCNLVRVSNPKPGCLTQGCEANRHVSHLAWQPSPFLLTQTPLVVTSGAGSKLQFSHEKLAQMLALCFRVQRVTARQQEQRCSSTRQLTLCTAVPRCVE